MKPTFLLDENLSPAIKTQLQIKEPSLDVVCIGEPGILPKGTQDPDILIWTEQRGYILVTNNRASMPVHVTTHLAARRSFPGILLIKPDTTMGQVIFELNLIWDCSEAAEYTNKTEYIPL